ncbi:MAG TPA: 30S ribosomal protein S6 [Verrucomicrobiota bacterium]|nr:30S ribosomal protein S6 [Verrucomicrobiota bacterium]HNU49614.1 30S ribosomal protein S6 [Verrucomicrobiota bacterium]
MKRYEGLFILNTAGREENAKELIDKVAAEITAQGGTIETIQKMDKRSFARVADKRHSAGFYVNIIFSGTPALVSALRARFVLNEDVFRVLITVAPPAKQAVPAAS